MTQDRRRFIKIIGGGTIIAAGAGAGVFFSTRTPTKALAPWQQAGNFDEPRKRALSYAILAPNPHNRQPWIVDLSTKDQILLYVDPDRLLPQTDPFSRQITIGFGCMLELLRMAAAQDGYNAIITEFPDGFDNKNLDKRPIARVIFDKDTKTEKDPLFKQILQRRSFKVPFDLERKVSSEVLEELKLSIRNGVKVGTTNDLAAIQKMRTLSHDALQIEINTKRTHQESVDLFRIGKSQVNENPDGIDFSGPLFDTLGAIGYFSREAANDPNSSVYKQAVDAVMATVDTAMGYVWLTTGTNTRIDQLNAGRDWVRINLVTTQQGIGLHPISQALQEYSEMENKFSAVHKFLDARDETIQMLGRLGYAAQVAPTPRWPIEAKILKA